MRTNEKWTERADREDILNNLTLARQFALTTVKLQMFGGKTRRACHPIRTCFLCLLSTLRCNRRYNKNALRRGVKSRFLGDSIRNEEAIISTPNRIYSLKVFHFLLYRRSSILQDIYFLYLIRLATRVSVDRKYVCGCKVYTC